MPTSSDGADWADEITTVYRHDSARPHLHAVGVEARDFDAIFDHAKKSGERLAPEFVYNLYVQACAELLRVARERSQPDGILIHGQLKPQRIVVSLDGTLIVAEPDSPSERARQAKPGPGDRSYQAPEQASGRPVDARADIFSLALCIAELFLVKRLADPARIASGQVEAELVAALRGASRPAQELGRVLLKSLGREVDRRYRGLSPLLADLRLIGKRLGFHIGSSVTGGYVRHLFSKTPGASPSPATPQADPAPAPAPVPKEPIVDEAAAAGSLDIFAKLSKPPPPGWSQLLPPPPAVPAVAVPIPKSTSAPPPPMPRAQLVSGTGPSSVPPMPAAGAVAISEPSPAPLGLPPESEPPGLGRTVPPPSARPAIRSWSRSKVLLEAGVAKYRAIPLAWKTAAGALLVLLAILPLLSSNKGTLFVAVSGNMGQRLSGVATSVDGAKECVGDRCAFDLTPGMHELAVRAEGYVPQSQVVVVRSKDEMAANFRLEKAFSTLKVKALPEGTTLFVDGERTGKLPQQIELSPGQHKLRFEAPNYASEERTVELAIGESKSIGDVTLHPQIGKAKFDLRTPGVDVSLVSDNERRDHVDVSRPVELDMSRKWVLEVHKAGYPVLREPLDWGNRTEQTFIVGLDRGMGAGLPSLLPAPVVAPAVVQRSSLPSRAAPERADSRAAGALPAPAPADIPEAATPSKPERQAGKSECLISFNSIPASNVFLDGTRLGVTPQVRVSVRPGSHTVQFMQGDVRKSKPFSCEGGESKIVAMHLGG